MRFPRYFSAYGGLNSIVTSKFFYVAAAMTLLCSSYFSEPKWWELAISVVPGLVGFAIAGVAIFISLGSDSLRREIAGKRPGDTHQSPFISFMAMFTHFIVVQLGALISAIIAKALYDSQVPADSGLLAISEGLRSPFWLFGGFLLCYALILCVSLAIEIYRLASMIDDYQTVINKTDTPID